MGSSSQKLPFRGYSLSPSADRVVIDTCGICTVRGYVIGGYYCNDPKSMFHKKCVELPSEINHPFHPQHPLLLTYYSQRGGIGGCDLCGEHLVRYRYSCSICKLNVDLTCGIKPPPSTIEHPICHDHPLFFLKKLKEEEEDVVRCDVCKDSIHRASYSRLECNVFFHLECAHLLKEVNYPCHPAHPLKLTARESLTDAATTTCSLCDEQHKTMLYHCSFCDVALCIACTESPPPSVIVNVKTHKHPLTLFARAILSTCNLCGLKTDKYSYVCLQCGVAVHASCIDLPQVININRHDHRISFTHHLGLGYLKCGVCLKSVCQYTGAYSCLVCSNYAVHSLCATRYDTWDGVELEGTPETIKDIAPFKVVGDELICHFGHDKHTLKLHKNNIIHDESARCEACIHPVGFGPIYSCEECCFIFHERCANLPMQKRLVFQTIPFLLQGQGNGVHNVLDCKLCGMYFTGFEYKSQESTHEDIDLHCGSLSEPFVHGFHSHPLYFDHDKESRCCYACQEEKRGYMLICDLCRFKLCLWCASLPVKVKHRNDEHPLTLCCSEKATGKYWCDICERELDPSIWFYTCFDCGGTVHIKCVLGDFSRLIPGSILDYKKHKHEVVLNNHNTRPECSWCSSRCKDSVILIFCSSSYVYYFCSRLCMERRWRYSFRF